MDKVKIDLNAPAFGEGAQKIEDSAAEEVATEPVVDSKPKEDAEPCEEGSKVPYSRFKKFHDRALEAEREAAEWRARAEAYSETTTRTVQPQIDLQDEAFQLWIENYGDNEASRKAWQNQLRITQTLEERALERAEQRAREVVKSERYEEEARTEQNVEKLDENFEDLSAFVGRELTEAEQSAVLDIVDDYTPKDKNGDYAGELLPFDKAWEIYELKTQVSKAPKVQSRNNVAGLSGNQSEGGTEVAAERDKSFNPLDWNAYRRRI